MLHLSLELTAEAHIIYVKCQFKELNLIKPVFYRLIQFILLEMLKANNLFLTTSVVPRLQDYNPS